MKRSALSSRAACIVAVAAFAVAACATDEDLASDIEPDQASTTVPVPAPTTTVELTAPPTTAAPPPTTAVTARTTVSVEPPQTTVPAEEVEPASITIWHRPRLHGTGLTATWTVSPPTSRCDYTLLDAEGSSIGIGSADTSGSDEAARSIRVDYDTNAEDLGSLLIECTPPAGDSVSAEREVTRVTYQNRHPDSVFPATDEHYFDHDEVRVLFPECRPDRAGRPVSDWLATDPVVELGLEDLNGDGYITEDEWYDQALDFWDSVFKDWDTVSSVTSDGREYATGWWTTRQLRMAYPYSTLTAANAPDEITLDKWVDNLIPVAGSSQNLAGDDWSVRPARFVFDGTEYYYHQSLYLRLVAAGASEAATDIDAGRNPHTGIIALSVRDDGIAAAGPNPPKPEVFPGNLLWDWMDVRYSYAPINKEPTAWAVRTLLETRNAHCVATKMREHCESGAHHESPHMRHPSQAGSRLGSVLWSTICPEVTP